MMETQQTENEKAKKRIVSVPEDQGDQENGENSGLKTLGILPMTGEEPYAELRAKVIKFRKQMDDSRWDLAEVLFAVNGGGSKKTEDRIYRRWGYDSFESYLSSEVSLIVRSAAYMTRIHQTVMVDLVQNLPSKNREEILGLIKELSWTKVRKIEPLVRKNIILASNLKSWIKKISKMNTDEIDLEVKILLAKDNGEDLDSEAIEPKTSKSAKNLYFRNVEIDGYNTVESALTLAAKMLDSENRNHQLVMMAQDFLATNMAQTPKGGTERDGYLNKIGALFGVHLVAIDKETNRIVYGNRDDFKAALTDEGVKDAN